MFNTIAFIPLRGGSKSIPLKNIKPLGGKPLAVWTIEAAANCAEIDRVFVATDNTEIGTIVRGLDHPKVEVVGRSPETATDTASTESAMIEFAEQQEFERIVLIQATSPLLTSADLTSAFVELARSSADSLLSVVPQKRFHWTRLPDGTGRPLNYDPLRRPRRQDFEAYYVENGAFYITRRVDLLQTRCRLSGKIAIQPMAEETYFEIDEPSDWTIAETMLRQRNLAIEPTQSALAQRADRIKLVVTDVDGVLTDAGMYYTENGDELKKFNTRDGKGFELLRLAGIKTGIITSEKTQIVERRARKLKVDFVYQGVADKRPAFAALLARTGLSADEVAYLGDDLADVPILEQVGLAACPQDAAAEAIAAARFRCQTAGGRGCFRELADFIVSRRNGGALSPVAAEQPNSVKS